LSLILWFAQKRFKLVNDLLLAVSVELSANVSQPCTGDRGKGRNIQKIGCRLHFAEFGNVAVPDGTIKVVQKLVWRYRVQDDWPFDFLIDIRHQDHKNNGNSNRLFVSFRTLTGCRAWYFINSTAVRSPVLSTLNGIRMGSFVSGSSWPI